MREAKPELLLREDLAEIWTQLALGWETFPLKSGPFGKGWCSGPVELPLARSSLKVSAYVVSGTSCECKAFLEKDEIEPGCSTGGLMKTRYGKEQTRDLILFLDQKKYVGDYTRVVFALSPTPPVKAILQKLGPQDHCWTGGSENRRFYVWKIEELWVLVNNTKGICLEVPVGTTSERAQELWSVFYSKVVKP